MSNCWLPQSEQTSPSNQSRTVVSAPKRSAIAARSGSTWRPQSRHDTISRTLAAAAFPRVMGGPLYLIRGAAVGEAPCRPFAVVGALAGPPVILASPGSPLGAPAAAKVDSGHPR